MTAALQVVLHLPGFLCRVGGLGWLLAEVSARRSQHTSPYVHSAGAEAHDPVLRSFRVPLSQNNRHASRLADRVLHIQLLERHDAFRYVA